MPLVRSSRRSSGALWADGIIRPRSDRAHGRAGSPHGVFDMKNMPAPIAGRLPIRRTAALHLLAVLLAWVALLMTGSPALAQPQAPAPAPGQGQDVYPPGRVGRLADIDGQVWVLSPESDEWVAAVRNQPITTG